MEPQGTGEYYSASDLAIAASFAMNLTDRFSFGLTGKYIRQNVWNESASGFALDVGVLYQTPLRGLKLGTCMANFGTDMQLEGRDLLRAFDDDPEHYSNDKLNVRLTTDEFSLPLLFRFGMSYTAIESQFHNLAFAVDLLHPSNNSENINLGTEYRIWQTLAFRVGYNSLFEKDSENGLTAGFGISKNMIGSLHISLDYSYSDWGLLENAQRISIALHL